MVVVVVVGRWAVVVGLFHTRTTCVCVTRIGFLSPLYEMGYIFCLERGQRIYWSPITFVKEVWAGCKIASGLMESLLQKYKSSKSLAWVGVRFLKSLCHIPLKTSTREDELRERIPHAWVCSADNYLKCTTAISRNGGYWFVHDTWCLLRLHQC